MQKIFIVFVLLLLGMIPLLAADCGDVDSSGEIDIVDALKCSQYYVGLHIPDFDEIAADVDGDGEITIVDALQIAQVYVGVIDELDGCLSSTSTPTPTSTSTPTPVSTPKDPEPVFAVNCGGGEFTASDGTEYEADKGFSGGQTYTNTESISGTNDDTLYQSERYGDCTYSATVPNGYYLVTLHFAETYHTSANSRSFDVIIEGHEEIGDLDIYAEVGGKTAYTTETYVTVSDGKITIEFETDTENAKINAIKVAIAGPAAAFSYSPALPLPDDTIYFDASASSDAIGTITDYSWNFGDGSTDSGETVEHEYAEADEYHVTLTVSDSEGYTGNITKTVTVYTGDPIAAFSIDPKAPKPDEEVTFDASESFDPGGSITNYAWDFGDGHHGSGETDTHTYSEEGEYEITLTVTDDDGNKDTANETVKVSASAGFVEDSGYDLQVGSPHGSNGGSSSTLPDPFTMWDGSQVKNMEDWRYRRRELVVEIEKRILGEKAPPPAKIGGTVSGSVSSSSYSVRVDNPGGSCSFSGTITGVPSQRPCPAVIHYYSAMMPGTAADHSVFSSEGVATIRYDCYGIASESSGNFTTGKYYDANPSYKGKTGALVAWAWGVSRIIDMLEKNPGVIDPTKIAVIGCSRFGKGAFVAGAFDERIALGIPTEPGTGGAAPLRALPSLGGQSLSNCNQEASWFGPMSGSYSSSMAVDMSDVAVMYAPRGFILMDNPKIDHLAFKANYLGCAAAYEVYKAMGKSDALWYMGSTNDGGHCGARAEYSSGLRAMVRKFLKGDTSARPKGGLDTNSSHGSINVSGWTSTWKKGTISE